MRNFHGTEIEIRAGFGPVGNTENLSQLWATFEGVVFSCFHRKKILKIL